MSSRILLSLLSLCIACFLLPSGVVGHAKLVYPPAWNSQPSKTQVCGVGAGQNTPAAYKVTTVDTTQLLSVQWTVVVGDGVGPLTARIDPTAKNNPTLNDFSITLQSSGTNNPNAVSNTPYVVKFQIPANTVCTGPSGTCTLRVASSSAWVACATITLTPKPTITTTIPPTTKAPTQAPTNPPTQAPSGSSGTTTVAPTTATPTTPPPTPTPTIPAPPVANFVASPSSTNPCAVASGLVTCSSINGQNVQLMGSSLEVLDANAQDEITLALTNSAVLTTPEVAGCQQAFTDLICAQSFPPCLSDTAPVCQSTCIRVNNLCAPNATLYSDGTSHASLYKCDNGAFTATTSDPTGNCPNVDTGVRPSGTTSTPTSTPTRTPTRTPTGTNHGMIVQVPLMIIALNMIVSWIVPHL